MKNKNAYPINSMILEALRSRASKLMDRHFYNVQNAETEENAYRGTVDWGLARDIMKHIDLKHFHAFDPSHPVSRAFQMSPEFDEHKKLLATTAITPANPWYVSDFTHELGHALGSYDKKGVTNLLVRKRLRIRPYTDNRFHAAHEADLQFWNREPNLRANFPVDFPAESIHNIAVAGGFIDPETHRIQAGGAWHPPDHYKDRADAIIASNKEFINYDEAEHLGRLEEIEADSHSLNIGSASQHEIDAANHFFPNIMRASKTYLETLRSKPIKLPGRLHPL